MIFKLTAIRSAFAIIIVFHVISFISCKSNLKQAIESKKSRTEILEHGRYLVSIIGCTDCHTPNIMTSSGPQKDTIHYLGGYPSGLKLPPYNKDIIDKWVLLNPTALAALGPWGVSFAANISSDSTGIGNWTKQQFSKAMREGKWKGLEGTRKLLPPMPLFQDMTDEDVDAIFTYLKSTKPIHNVPPNPIY